MAVEVTSKSADAVGRLLVRVRRATEEDSDLSFGLSDALLLADVMGDSIAKRDAVIAAVVCRDVSDDDLLCFAVTPHTPHAVTTLADAMSVFYEHGNPAYARRGAVLMDDVISRVPEALNVPLHAVAAYLYWAAGDDDGLMRHAVHVPADSRDASLVGIVAGAAQAGAHPIGCLV